MGLKILISYWPDRDLDNLSVRIIPRIKTGLNSWEDFWTKIGSSYEGIWFPGLVAGTSPFVLTDPNEYMCM